MKKLCNKSTTLQNTTQPQEFSREDAPETVLRPVKQKAHGATDPSPLPTAAIKKYTNSQKTRTKAITNYTRYTLDALHNCIPPPRRKETPTWSQQEGGGGWQTYWRSTNKALHHPKHLQTSTSRTARQMDSWNIRWQKTSSWSWKRVQLEEEVL